MAYDLELYSYLKRNLRICYITSLHDETRIRCPFCGDSRKDPNAARLYIKNEAPYKFICFNCEMAGIVDENFLNRLQLKESSFDISQFIKQKNQEVSRKGNFKTANFIKMPYFRKKLDFSITRQKDVKKLEYLNKRLGTTLTMDDVYKYKIVLNIQDFFQKNGIDINKRFKTERDKRQFILLREKYIGFLSADRNVIIFRNIDPNSSSRERFANIRVYLLDEHVYETKKTYVVSNKIDIYKPVHNIVIAEGVIDTIGVYEHFYKGKVNEENYIFMANGGKSYATTLKYINSLSLLDNNITIYSDSDVSVDLYKRLKANSPEFNFNPITIYYNTIGKDFGVNKDKISLSSKIIL